MDYPYDINYESLIKNEKFLELLLQNSKLERYQLKELIYENDQYGIWSRLKTKVILNVGYSHDWGGELGIVRVGGFFFNYIEYGKYQGTFMSFEEAIMPLEDYLVSDETTGTIFEIESSLPIKTTLKIFKDIVQPGECLTINNDTYCRNKKGLVKTHNPPCNDVQSSHRFPTCFSSLPV